MKSIFKKIFKSSTSNISLDSQKLVEFDEENYFIDKRDGKKYKTVKIGKQLWMAENLNYDSGVGCWIYDDSSSNAETFGRLYDWENAKQSAPSGWHLPTDEEWKELEIYLGMNPVEAEKESSDRGIAANIGGKLKSISGWKKPNTGANNESDFNALPGGSRDYYSGTFNNAGKDAYFWTCTPSGIMCACYRCLSHNSGKVSRYDNIGRSHCFSVRCVKDKSKDISISLSPQGIGPLNEFDESPDFSFLYPYGWEKEYTEEGALIFRPIGVKLVPIQPFTYEIGVTLIVSTGREKAPSIVFDELLNAQPDYYDSYNLIYSKNTKLESDHPALEYNFSFKKSRYKFHSIAIAAVNGKELYMLDVSGLKSKIIPFEDKCWEIVRSLLIK